MTFWYQHTGKIVPALSVYRFFSPVILCVFIQVESISDPLKHLVTITFILLPPYYFKNFLNGEFSASIVRWSGCCLTCVMFWVRGSGGISISKMSVLFV